MDNDSRPDDPGVAPPMIELPDNWEELLTGLHKEFYGGPLVHADAFRILPLVVSKLRSMRSLAKRL